MKLAVPKLDKPVIVLWSLWVAVLPWLTGGREPAALIITLAALGLGLFLVWRLPGLRPLHGRGLLWSAGGLLGWAALSLFWSVNRYQSFSWLLVWLLAAIAFGLAYQLATEWSRVKAWLSGYIIIAVVFSSYGFWLYVIEPYERLTASFFWPNPMAAYLLPAVLLTAWYWADQRRKWALPAGVITTTALILTDSRSIYLLIGLIAVWVGLRLRRPPAFWGRLAVMAGLSAIAVLGLNALRAQHQPQQIVVAPGSRFADVVQEESVSRDDRFYYTISALQIWSDYPLAGTGAGTYASIHSRYQIRVISAARNAHNFYVQTFSELGIIGLALMITLGINLLLGLRRGVIAERRALPLAIGAGLLLLHLGLDIDSEYPALVILLATMLGLVWRPQTTGAAQKPWPASSLLMALMVVAVPSVGLYRSQTASSKAELFQAEGDLPAAIISLRQARTDLVYDPDIVLREGILYYTLARLGKDSQINLLLARDRAQTAASLDPWDAQHPFLLARSQRLLGEVSAATEAYQQALRLDPYNNPQYYSDPAELALEKGNLDEALRLAEGGIGLYPDNVIANRHAQAEISPAVARLYVARATARLARSDIAGAEADLQRAAQLDPMNASAKKLLIGLKANSGQ